MAGLKQLARRAFATKVVARSVQRMNRVVAAEFQDDILERYSPKDLFKHLLHGEKDLTLAQFPGRKSYILTDSPVSDHVRARLGPVIASLDGLSDDEVRNGLFYIYYICDSDALPSLRRISELGGRYIPHLSFEKTQYRFADRQAYEALRRTWTKRDRVSHLSTAVHENICEALSITRRLEGDYVEVGVFLGGSALTALNFLDVMRASEPGMPGKKAWLFDTFDGFEYDEAYESADAIWAGTHKLWGRDKTIAHIRETLAGTSTPYELVPSNICADALPAGLSKVAVANIDVDMYEPTLAAMQKISPLMADGGIMICEDAASTPSLYGAYQAMEDFLGQPEGAEYVKIFKGGQYFLMKVVRSS